MCFDKLEHEYLLFGSRRDPPGDRRSRVGVLSWVGGYFVDRSKSFDGRTNTSLETGGPLCFTRVRDPVSLTRSPRSQVGKSGLIRTVLESLRVHKLLCIPFTHPRRTHSKERQTLSEFFSVPLSTLPTSRSPEKRWYSLQRITDSTFRR